MSPRRLRAIVRRVVRRSGATGRAWRCCSSPRSSSPGLLTFILREGDTPDVRAVAGQRGERPGGDRRRRPCRRRSRTAGITVTEAPDEDAARAVVAGRHARPWRSSSRPTCRPAADHARHAGARPDRRGGPARRRPGGRVHGASPGSPVRRVPTIVHETVYGTGSDDPMAPFAPAIVAFFLYFFVYLLTGRQLPARADRRHAGAADGDARSPAARSSAATRSGFGLFATIQVAVLLTWALGTVHVPGDRARCPRSPIGLGIAVAGSPLLAFLVVVLLALGAVSLGIFLSTFARTELQVIQFIPIVLVPQFLLSGVLFPVDSLPAILQPLVAIMPLGYAVDALRQVFIRGRRPLGGGAPAGHRWCWRWSPCCSRSSRRSRSAGTWCERARRAGSAGPPGRRTGRRPGSEDTRGRILRGGARGLRRARVRGRHHPRRRRPGRRGRRARPPLLRHASSSCSWPRWSSRWTSRTVVPRLLGGPREGMGERFVRFVVDAVGPARGAAAAAGHRPLRVHGPGGGRR